MTVSEMNCFHPLLRCLDTRLVSSSVYPTVHREDEDPHDAQEALPARKERAARLRCVEVPDLELCE